MANVNLASGVLHLDGDGLNQLTGGLDSHQATIDDEAPQTDRAVSAAAGMLRSARPHRSAGDLAERFSQQAAQLSAYCAAVIASMRGASVVILQTDAQLGASIDSQLSVGASGRMVR